MAVASEWDAAVEPWAPRSTVKVREALTVSLLV
jgi:hypothetical protein